MDYNDDNNPFADSSNRQSVTTPFANQSVSSYGHNPFADTTPITPTYQPSAPPSLPTPQPAVYEPSIYQPPLFDTVVKPVPIEKPAENKYNSPIKDTTIHADVKQNERQQTPTTERSNSAQAPAMSVARVKNFPPLPRCCPCGPCFYQDISIDIPEQFRLWVRYIYIVWLAYVLTLLLNFIGALSYFAIDKDGATTFGISIVYLFLFPPLSYVCWFRQIYRAFRTDSSVSFMIFFLISILNIATKILFATGLVAGMCGFAKIGIMSKNKAVGTMMIILASLWSLISLATVLLTIKVHRLYRQTGANIEKAQRELQTAFVNNETVRGAAAAGITGALNSA